MKLLRLLLCSLVVTLSLGLMTPLSAQSGCGSGQSSCGCFDPGIMQTPPCALAQIATDDKPEPGQTQTVLNSDPIDVTSSVEAALIALLLF